MQHWTDVVLQTFLICLLGLKCKNPWNSDGIQKQLEYVKNFSVAKCATLYNLRWFSVLDSPALIGQRFFLIYSKTRVWVQRGEWPDNSLVKSLFLVTVEKHKKHIQRCMCKKPHTTLYMAIYGAPFHHTNPTSGKTSFLVDIFYSSSSFPRPFLTGVNILPFKPRIIGEKFPEN